MSVVAIVQARMGSTRLPGKALLRVAGKTLLAWHLERLAPVSAIDQIVVATSGLAVDDPIAVEARRLGCEVFRGDETDVLDRYHGAATAFGATVVLRTTSDCPLLATDIVVGLLRYWSMHPLGLDYASTGTPRYYPRGMDCEVMKMSALECAWREANLAHDREHVTSFIYHHPHRFLIGHMKSVLEMPDVRLTVDTPDDLDFVRRFLESPGAERFNLRDILTLLAHNPSWQRVNAHVRHKEA